MSELFMDEFKTPVKIKKGLNCQTPLIIPPSPLLKRLGYGTGAGVFRMERSPVAGAIRSPWALKYLNKDKLKQENCSTFSKRLRDEANILQKLNHPNIVGFRKLTNLQDGRDVLAMEDCQKSLGDLIEVRAEMQIQSPFPADQIMKMLLDMGRALSYLHTEALILHGDIKSYNILALPNLQNFKLCDFGVSLPLTPQGLIDLEKNGLGYVGTACWGAPETMFGSNCVGTKADLFSLGLTAWEMLALYPPHTEPIDYESKQENFADCSDLSVVCLDDSLLEVKSPSNTNSQDKENTPYNTNSSEMYSDDSNVSDIGSSKYGTRPNLPNVELDETYNNVLELFYCMTEHDPDKRPTAAHLVQYIIAIPSLKN